MTRPTVLIVDDDGPTRAAYTAFLTDHGYDVLEAVHGGEAILHVYRHRPDLVLMDLFMPILDGVETAEALRAAPPTARTPILAITASACTPARERMRLVCDDLLEKPCAPAEILARIEALTGKPE
jgi:two-component system, OmpR family, phosphate regulon response regulator PhoB